VGKRAETKMSMEKGRILVVDDDEAVQRYLAFVLRRQGYTTCAACDGQEALYLLEHQEFAIILLDIYMPGKGGFETLVEVLKRYPNVGIVVMSGGSLFGSNSSLEIARSLGAHVVLSKPFRASELLETIARFG
jgi:CheY-like chemotaxis protein